MTNNRPDWSLVIEVWSLRSGHSKLGLVITLKRSDMVRSSLLTLALLTGVAASVQAAKVKVWHQHRPAQFDKARLRQAVVSNEGTIRLSKRLRPLTGIE